MKLVDVSIEIAADPMVVYELFTTESGLREWMAADAEVDLRPGGAWRWLHDNGNACSGEYVEIDPPERLSFTYGWENGDFADVRPGSTLVEVRFEPTSIGTRVAVTHRGLADQRAEHHSTGWTHFLGRLAETANKETT